MKDKGMFWVIVANVMAVCVIVLLLTARHLERKENAQNAQKAQKEQVAQVLPDNYDFDIVLDKQDCENVNGNVDIVLITDSNYVDYTRVAMLSAIKNKCPLSKYNFHLMTLDISDKEKALLNEFASDDVSVNILPQEEIDLFYIKGTHVSKAALLKYYIPNVLPDLEKALYIDGDVLILTDLSKLNNTDISDVYLAAVKDPSWFFDNKHVLELDLEYRGFYFNTGVMLMNLAKLRDDNMIAKLEEYTNNNYRTYMDQDALNVLVKNDVKLLDFEYNAINFFFEHIELAKMAEFYHRNWQTYEEVFSPVTILHFASVKKPDLVRVPKTDFYYMLQRLWYSYYNQLEKIQ